MGQPGKPDMRSIRFHHLRVDDNPQSKKCPQEQGEKTNRCVTCLLDFAADNPNHRSGYDCQAA